MIGELAMLPLRVGVRVTRLWFRAVEETVSVTATATGRMIELLSSRGPGEASVATAPPPASSTAPRSRAGERGPGRADGEGVEARSDGEGVEARPDGEGVQVRSDAERAQGRTDAERAPARPDGEPARPDVQPPTEVRDLAPPMTQPAPGPPLSAEPAHVSEEPELVEEFAEPGAEEGAGAEVRVDPPWDGYQQMNAKQVISRLAGASPAELAAVELYEGSHRRRQTIMNAVDRELRHPDVSGSPTQERG